VEQFTYSNDGKLALKNSPMRVLYDRANDPHQLKNLYGQRDAALLQNEMERLTKKWLKHFDDPGAELSFEDLNRLYSYNDGHFPEDTEEQGFRGRPIDIIKKNYKTKS
jgi:hypothetical protein